MLVGREADRSLRMAGGADCGIELLEASLTAAGTSFVGNSDEK